MPITQLQKCRGAKMRPLLRAQRCTNKKVATPPPHTSPLTPHHLDARTVARHKLKMRECQTTFTFTYKMQKELNARPYNWVRGQGQQGQELRAGTVPTGRGRAVCVCVGGRGFHGLHIWVRSCEQHGFGFRSSIACCPPPHAAPAYCCCSCAFAHFIIFYDFWQRCEKACVTSGQPHVYPINACQPESRQLAEEYLCNSGEKWQA